MAKPELRDHRKFLKLKRLLGAPTPHVIGYLDCLWHRGYQTGNPFIGDALDVEAAAEFPGEPGTFAEAAHQAGFIDKTDDGYAIHDLYEHAPKYAKLRMQRRGNVQKPARTCHDEPMHGTEVEQTCHDLPETGTNVPLCAPSGHENPRSVSITQNQEPKTENPIPEPKTENKSKTKARVAFVPPSVDEVREYCSERGNGIDPEAFVDFYVSKGWKVGSEPMRDWKACVRTWEKRSRDSPTLRGSKGPASKTARDEAFNQVFENFMNGKKLL